MKLGSVAFLAAVTPPGGPPPSGNIVAELLTGAPFGFAIVPGDATITRCYVETTGASATTLCVDEDEIGTIECVPTGTYITYPSGVKPVFHTSGGDSWIEMQSGGKLFFEQSAYTGAGDMLMSMAAINGPSAGAATPCLLGVTSSTNAWWNSSQRAGILQSGIGVETLRGFAGHSMDDFGILADQIFVLRSIVGELAWNTAGWRDGTGTTFNDTSDTWSDRGGWNINRAAFLTAVDESSIFDGRFYGGIIVRVDATTEQLEDLATYLGALVGLTI